MTDPALRDLLDDAARPDRPLDLASLARRVHHRRRRRAAGRALAVLAASAVLAVGGPSLLMRGGVDPVVELAGRDAGLEDPGRGAPVAQAPASAPDVEDEPTSLPEGYHRCDGPTRAGVLTVTAYCAQGRPQLTLAQGPHYALPEVGEQHAVAERIGYLRRDHGRTTMTVSDANSDADRHHRLTVEGDPDADAGLLADVLASIPSVAAADPPSR